MVTDKLKSAREIGIRYISHNLLFIRTTLAFWGISIWVFTEKTYFPKIQAQPTMP